MERSPTKKRKTTMTNKSNEIIRTIRDLLDHYLPWLMGLILFILASVIFNEGMKEIDGLELDNAEAGLIMLFAFSFFYWTLGCWAGDNSHKIKKDEIDTDNKTT